LITAYIKVADWSIFTKVFSDEFDYACREALALEVEDKLGSCFMTCFSNAKSEATLIDNACDDSDFSFKVCE